MNRVAGKNGTNFGYSWSPAHSPTHPSVVRQTPRLKHRSNMPRTSVLTVGLTKISGFLTKETGGLNRRSNGERAAGDHF
jgi:hypothetical protein